MMQKPVRYYITESEDRPVVRTVSVTVRQEPDTDRRAVNTPASDTDNNQHDSRRSRLRDRLKLPRLHVDFS